MAVSLMTLVTPVALLAEGVDRNTYSGWDTVLTQVVALLAEGVDRNMCCTHAI